VGLLGRVHGDVGVLEQFGGVVAVVGVDGDPDAGVQVQGHPVQDERRMQGGAELVGDRGRPLGGRPWDQHGELVPAEPGHGVDLPQRSLEPRPDLAQQLVAVVVPEGVVDVLEAVQVQQQQGRRLQLPGGHSTSE
jgi:hypothetical protein